MNDLATHTHTLRLDAACVADADRSFSPGTLVLGLTGNGEDARSRVLYAGPPESLPAHLHSVARTIRLPGSTLLPAFANAHTHLDLTGLGPRPYDPETESFDRWLSMIVRDRPTEPERVYEAVELGLRLSLAGGVVAVGDIAGQTSTPRIEPFRAMRASPVRGVSFLEYFAIGAGETRGFRGIRESLEAHAEDLAIEDPSLARLGVQPHAPYSVSARAYEDLAGLLPAHTPRSTHAAETLAEREFIARGTGPQRDFLHTLGVWDDSILETLGQGDSPIRHLEPILRSSGSPWLIAHANDTSDEDIRILAESGASVAFCPRSHRYFGHLRDLPAHRWPDMLGAGVAACLGTDSIVNLDTPDRITPLDDARLLSREGRDAATPETLLRMITQNPARALGMNPDEFAFDEGPLAGLVEIPGAGSLAEVFESDRAPSLLFVRNHSDLIGK
ncbi:MAG: amidohydrolase family protein [Phycisphaerales bacterium JB040]